MGSHPGAYGFQRKNHCHEGVDFYADEGTPVFAVEAGVVTAVKAFTGPALGHDWWLATDAVWILGSTGTVLYGEIKPLVEVGQAVAAGEQVGTVLRVIAKDKGRPNCMLHLELHTPGSTEAPEWYIADEKPAVLRDPTPYLLAAAQKDD